MVYASEQDGTELLWRNVTSGISGKVALTIYVHHFVSTIPSEVEFIWRLPRKSMKILYLINRYTGLVIVVLDAILQSNISCGHYTLFHVASMALLFGTVQAILMVRLYVILGNKQKYALPMAASFLVECGAATTISILHGKTTYVTLGSITLCQSEIGLILLPAIIFDSAMALLIIYRAVLHARRCQHMGLPVSWGYGGHLFIALAKDSLQYYFCIITIMVLGLLVYTTPPTITMTQMSAILTPWILVIPTISATHMVLHLHHLAHHSSVPIQMIQQ